MRLGLPLGPGAALVTLALLPGPAAEASLVLAMDLPEVIEQADRIVVGDVVSVVSRWDERRERISSFIEIRVGELWKGAAPADGRLTLVQPGGRADGIEMIVHGLPPLRRGERAVFFLRGARPQGLSLVGMSQGHRPMRFDAAGKRWLVHGADMSAVVRRDAQGALRPVPAEAPIPLEELRRRVAAVLRQR